jgi:hypothetical protein
MPFTLFKRLFVENGERIGAYIKGLGLSEEGQAALAESAIKTGKSLQEIGREITTYAFQMGEAFGINGKQISRDVGAMMADVNNFGNLSVQTLTNVSVFARRLGVEFKALLGVVDKFDNFEQAAEGVAHLSQAFGLQLDTLQLLNAQDPAERIEMLRKSFFEAGRSVENMTRQERALLATTNWARSKDRCHGVLTRKPKQILLRHPKNIGCHKEETAFSSRSHGETC